MRYLSLFSGIEAATVAWEPLGWKCVGVAEIEKFPCAVLKHHYPHIPNLGDVTKITDEQIAALGPINLIVGGFPCQDLSVAGKRKGFEHEGERTRSGLFHDAMRIVRAAKKHCGLRFLLLENVPGIFSSRGGNDFATVVNEILGTNFIVPKNKWQKAGVAVGPHGMFEWATLDAQYFGLAQRRKRMFALADFGDWANRPPILLEPQSVCGDTPPRIGSGAQAAHPLRRVTASNRETFPCLLRNVEKKHWLGNQEAFSGDYFINENGLLRYLTATESERLQGLPDGYTDVGGVSDWPRIGVCGNSFAVPVVNWIGRKLEAALNV